MKRITVLAMVLCILLNLQGHIPTAYITIDLTPGAHPLPIRMVYRLGWPVPALALTDVQGCTTTLYLEWEWLTWAVFYDVLFWLAVIYILERGWPVNTRM